MSATRRASWIVDRTWDDRPVEPDESVRVDLVVSPDAVRMEVDAPYFADPPPDGAPGCFDGLWNHQVVELFLLGADERYLELELGPGGHHLALLLDGVRSRSGGPLPAESHCQISGARWRGGLQLDAAWLPVGLFAANAYAIHGVGGDRRYLAASAPGGDEPDFHRLACFTPIVFTDESGGR